MALFAIIALLPQPARAQVVLKPNGRNAIPLRTRAIDADVTIHGQFALTKQTVVFLNTTSERVEADFLYTLPAGAIVTYFAYWYGDEKVVARVVEKERATAIYQHITTRMRDPALVEMVGKNTFRARIFPVMPEADLKVEMRIAQVPPSTTQGFTYRLPLRQAPGSPLDSLRVRVRVDADAAIRAVTNSLDLPVIRDRAGWAIRLSGENYRPEADLVVSARRSPAPLRVTAYAARRGGRDGFFALTLTPNTTLSTVRAGITSAGVYDVIAEAKRRVGAGGTLTLVGRYRGTPAATVWMAGKSAGRPWRASARVRFGGAAAAENVASTLWAARRIEQLGGRYAAVVALSKRFTLPSRYTSWLAVPREELQRYKTERAEAEAQVLAQQVARALASGLTARSPVSGLLHRLRALCKREYLSAETVLFGALEPGMRDTAYRLAQFSQSRTARRSPTARMLRARLALMCRLSGSSISDWLPAGMSDFDRATALRLQREINALEAHLDSLRGGQVGNEAVWAQERKLRQLYARFGRTVGAESYWKQYGDNTLFGIHVREMLPPSDVSVEPLLQRDLLAQTPPPGSEYLWRARAGDPLIRVLDPADAVRVVAVMPGGDIKLLVYNAVTHAWEGRFDIPVSAREGRYEIDVIVLRRNGARTLVRLYYYVDLTAPRGVGAAVRADGAVLTLRCVADPDTARITALLPWGDRAQLYATGVPGRFFARVAVPPGWPGRRMTLRYILTDRAHNRTTIEVTPD